MKRFKYGIWIIVALSLGLLLGGCTGKGGDGDKPAGEGKPAAEKKFVYGTIAYSPSMGTVGTNPHDAYVGWSTLRYGIGETLFRFSQDMKLEPWLAKSYEQVDDYTVKIVLRDDVTFSNGRPMTGAAVKACLEALLEKHDRAPKDLKLAEVTAEGQTITLVSAEKAPALLHYLADPYACIIDVEAGEKDRIVVGTGPYMAEKVTDSEMVLKKNDKYWGQEKPKLDHITIKGIADGDTLTMALQSGEIDAAQGLPYSSLEIFRKDSAKYRISSADTSRVYQVMLNLRTPALEDLRVRRAIAMGIDKENFAKVLLHGNGTPAIGPFPGSMSFGGDRVKAAAFDPAAAKQLLAEAGYKDTNGDGFVDKDGQNLTLRWLTYTSRQELPLLAESAQASLKQIGIDVKVNASDNYKADLKAGAYDAFGQAFVTAPTGDPEYYFVANALASAANNHAFYQSEALEAMAVQLRDTFGREERGALAIKMGQQILDDAAFIYAAHLRMSLAMKAGVEGFMAHPSDYYEITAALDKK